MCFVCVLCVVCALSCVCDNCVVFVRLFAMYIYNNDIICNMFQNWDVFVVEFLLLALF